MPNHPPTVNPKLLGIRKDQLWENNCFEFFLGFTASPQYLEGNLAPNGDWNIFLFDEYRKNKRPYDDLDIGISSTGNSLEVVVDFKQMLHFESLGLAAMMFTLPNSVEFSGPDEASKPKCDGYKQNPPAPYYFALKHSHDNPDFHARNCWAFL